MCLANGSFPCSLFVASLITAITIWKQLVLCVRMPSALHEAARRQTVVLHIGRTGTGRSAEGGETRLGKIRNSVVEVYTLALSWQSLAFYFFSISKNTDCLLLCL